MRRAIRLALVAVVAAELLLAAYLWLPMLAGRQALPVVEEHHYIILTVRDPEGRVVEERAHRTNSVVNPEVLAVRLFSTWRLVVDKYTTTITRGVPATPLDVVGNPAGSPYTDRVIDDHVYHYPSLVFLGSGSGGGQTLGNPLGVSSTPSVSYTYDSTWFNITIVATFSFSNPATVSEAILGAIDERGISIVYLAIIYDSFPPVSVPAGGSLTIQWVFAWKDYGALTENWGRLWQYALTLNYVNSYGGAGQYVNFTDDTGATVSIPWPNAYNDTVVAARLAWGTGTSPMSRSSYRLQSEAGSVQAGLAITGTGFSVGGAVGSPASEVGLYWLARGADGNVHRILLMRWVPSYTLPAGTPINIYAAKGG